MFLSDAEKNRAMAVRGRWTMFRKSCCGADTGEGRDSSTQTNQTAAITHLVGNKTHTGLIHARVYIMHNIPSPLPAPREFRLMRYKRSIETLKGGDGEYKGKKIKAE